MTAKQKIVLFDMDGTLIDVNSMGLLFLDDFRAGKFSFFDLVRAGLGILRVKLGVDQTSNSNEEGAKLLIGRLKGTPVKDYLERHRQWFMRRIADHLRPGAVEALKKYRDEGALCVLASATFEYLAYPAGDAWGFGPDEIVCTTLGKTSTGEYDGTMLECGIGSGKYHNVLKWLKARGVDPKETTFFTDSIGDIELLESVGEPVAVNPDPKLCKIAIARGWQIVDWGKPEKKADPPIAEVPIKKGSCSCFGH